MVRIEFSRKQCSNPNRRPKSYGRLLRLMAIGLSVACIFSFFCINEKSGVYLSRSHQQNDRHFRGHSQDVSGFQICRPDKWSSYVCKGPEYDLFADKLESLLKIFEQQESPLAKPPAWGKRKGSPFAENSTILAIGNSHTRQIVQSLGCQYELLQSIDMESNATNAFRRGSYYFFEFQNHAKLHLVTNHAIFYSRQWRKYLQEMTGISSLDAMIVGQVNGMIDAYNTSFMDLMIEKTSKLEDADFTTVDPPQVKEFAEFFDGPIVAHSLMCYWGYDNYFGMNDVVGTLNRPNVQIVNGRSYIGMLGECSTNEWQTTGVCSADPTGHRCIGDRGGHPDLLAWDIVEALEGMVDSANAFPPKW